MAVDYPFTNVVGFTCYTISQAAFLFSSTIKSQYAYRHPTAPVSTVRVNDFAFGFHGMVLCIVVYSQFFPAIWGFDVGKHQTASSVSRGIVWGSFVSVIVTIIIVTTKSHDGGYDPSGWAWIEVVSIYSYPRRVANGHPNEPENESGRYRCRGTLQVTPALSI